ncbi:Holliday junction branch migration DNA helicase RuvB [Mycoplasma buteonis]|uniref:Holliday junction branch migration DNA helicase RuvB n=1 Tax=Mycoplasma buteonis TaxID=171280 RepID=UPI00055F543F|nr:Holliday junction branch migration DNA helicase RuvB [Mycoplasma buteonis]
MASKNLRPQSFKDFIGQEKLIITLKAMIKSSQVTKKPVPHILLYGSPGTGKTTLATIIANETGNKIHYVQGSNIEKKADLINILSVISENDIVFIDEIHSVNKNVIEMLYVAMEEFVFDLIIGVEENARAMRMKLKPFTLIGATTKINLIAQPLKDRFGYLARIGNYSDKDIEKILMLSAKRLNITLLDEDRKYIASYSRYIPRLANNLLERVNDFAIWQNNGQINQKVINKTFKSMELYPYGLTKDHLEYLEILYKGFNYKYASLDTISGLVLHTKETIINEIEPILLFLNFIDKSSRGRKITKKGIEYLQKPRLITH